MNLPTKERVDKILNDIAAQVELLAQTLFAKYWKSAAEDMRTFLVSRKDQLAKWTDMLSTKQLTQDEFNFLVQGQVALAELNSIKKADLRRDEMDAFKSGVAHLLTDLLISATTSGVI